MNPTRKRILVFRIGHLGDTIVTLPAFWSIRDAYPDAHIALLSNSDAANKEYVAARSVLPEKGLFDEWIVYSNAAGAMGAAAAFSGLLRTLRKQKFDTVFYLMTRNRSAGRISRDRMFFRTAGIKEFTGGRFLLDNLIDPSMEKPLPTISREADFFLNMLKDAGIETPSRGAEMLFSTEEKDAADAWLSDACGNGFTDLQMVAVAPGSKWSSKVWDENRFVEVLRQLIKDFGVFPVIFGGPEDREKGQRILSSLGTGANAAGELNIRKAAAAMRHCGLYLGNDTGTMHMAAAAGVRCVAVFAAIDFPGRWYPYGEGHKVFRFAVECEGCHTPDCFNDHLCLTQISVEAVTKACAVILGS